MTVKRQCANWLETFMQWTLPRSEAPETYIYWTGLFTLSAVLRRKVKIPKGILGSWECPPHLYVMFIAPPGEARKTTTMSYGIDLLDELPHVVKGPAIITQASLMDKLMESDDSSVYLTAEEFSDLIMKSKGEMFEFLTSMFDGKKTIEASTISRGVQFAEKPCINLLAATTPVWVAENMSEAIIGGGFASRVVFVYEETVRRKQLIYKGKMDTDGLAHLRRQLVDDLIYIEQSITGDFDLTPDAVAFMEHWYQSRTPETNKKLKGFHEREPAHTFKVAMLQHIARSDDLVLDVQDFESAIATLSVIKQKLPRVFEGIGKNPYTFDMRYIIEYVQSAGRVEKATLLEHFAASAPPSLLTELVEGLITIRKIKVKQEADGKFYYVPGDRA